MYRYVTLDNWNINATEVTHWHKIYCNPNWALFDASSGPAVHEWMAYVPDELREIWPELTDHQRVIIGRTLDDIAGREHWD
jgi:hypothetical protein